MYTQNQNRVHFSNSVKGLSQVEKLAAQKYSFQLYLQIFDLSSFWELSKCLLNPIYFLEETLQKHEKGS